MLLFLAIGVGGDSVLVAAQPQTPTCNADEIRRYLRSGQFPSLKGCTEAQAKVELSDFFPQAQYTPRSTAEAPEGIIFQQDPDPGFNIRANQVRGQFFVAAPPPSYSIADAPDAAEGEPLVFKVTRSGRLADAASIGYELSTSAVAATDFTLPPAVADTDFTPPSDYTADFAANSQETEIRIDTLQRAGENRPRRVSVRLTQVSDGGPITNGEAIGTINDAAEPSFSVSADRASIERGAQLAFTIRRTGPLAGKYSVAYRIDEYDADGTSSVAHAEDQAVRITVPDGQPEVSLPPFRHAPCTTLVIVTLSDPQLGSTIAEAGGTASADIGGEPPQGCPTTSQCRELPEPFDQLGICAPRGVPLWPIVVLVVVTIGGTAFYNTPRRRLRRRLRRIERLTPAVVACQIKAAGDCTPAAQPQVSPAQNPVQVTIADGALRPGDKPAVSVKEQRDD